MDEYLRIRLQSTARPAIPTSVTRTILRS